MTGKPNANNIDASRRAISGKFRQFEAVALTQSYIARGGFSYIQQDSHMTKLRVSFSIRR